jgi:exodeoxyribonuclease-3
MSWNVNGIRAVLKNGFLEVLNKYQPDVLALQEVKISENDRGKTELDFPGYTEIWHSAERPGYSGTAILIKEKSPLKIIKQTNGLNHDQFDSEGRVQTIEFENFYFVNAYFPNTRHDLSRLDFKIEFNNKIFAHVKKLEKNKPVIITGDFNVAHTPIDLAHPKENEKNAGFTIEERTSCDKFLKQGMIDTFRHTSPKKIQYSWWTYRFGARSRNMGWRIDYFLVSDILKNKIIKAEILDQVLGSDHCPVSLKIDL